MDKEKIKEAGKPKRVKLWTSLYNNLCRKCKMEIFKTVADNKGSKELFDKMDEAIKNNLCNTCRRRMNKVIGDVNGN